MDISAVCLGDDAPQPSFQPLATQISDTFNALFRQNFIYFPKFARLLFSKFLSFPKVSQAAIFDIAGKCRSLLIPHLCVFDIFINITALKMVQQFNFLWYQQDGGIHNDQTWLFPGDTVSWVEPDPKIPRWRHQMETFSALLAVCAGNSPLPVNSPHAKARDAELWCFLRSVPE